MSNSNGSKSVDPVDPFDGMDPNAARVLIAKDVIKWLRLGKFKATPGTYVELKTPKDREMMSKPTDAKDLLNLSSRLKPCYVCQRGALMLAAVDRFDKCEVTVGHSLDWTLDAAASYDEPDGLGQFFSVDQYEDMECAFEGKWLKRYPKASDRMDAICRNLIKNNGVFIIDDIPKPRPKPRPKSSPAQTMAVDTEL